MDPKNEGRLDLRQRKTRRLLVQALCQLLEERPFSELSVVDICDRAMVHRTTFYAHFNDKQELLHYTLEQMERECIETCLPQGEKDRPKQYFLTAARNALRFFRERKAFYQACIASGAVTEARVLEEYAAQELSRRIREFQLQDIAPKIDPEIAAHFYVGAMLSLIRWWLSSDSPIPEDKVLSDLEQFIPIL